MIRRICVAILAVYLAACAIGFAGAPHTFSRNLPLLPTAFLHAPFVVASYGQFLKAGVWPYRHDPNAVSLDRLIPTVGTMDGAGEGVIYLDMHPEHRSGGEGRELLTLHGEHYTREAFGGFMTAGSGAMMTMGDYTCLSAKSSGWSTMLMPSARCYRFFPLGGQNYEMRGLWQVKGRSVIIVRSR